MEKYEVLNRIGDGSFGTVMKAVSKKTGQLVAIKKMKQRFYTWDECVKLPEVDVVRKIHGHPNIVKLREVIREGDQLYFVFEFMDGDMLGVIKKAKQTQKTSDSATAPAIPYPTVKSYMQQVLQSLAYLHKRGYFHRDMKPENLLVSHEDGGEDIVKLADFGLVKDVRARPPFTDYVSTRWYRAPELLLQDSAYGPPVDIWAAGCIMAELITTRPLFPGSNEVDQLFKIMSALGSPTERTWAGGMRLAKKIHYSFPTVQGCGLAAVLPKHLPAQALDLIAQMLTYDPKTRLTAEQCLQHPFFSIGIDESNGPSAAVLAQLATASKRLQHHQQQSPQSAPAALTGPGAAASNAAAAAEARGWRSGDTAAIPSTVSPQLFFMVGQGKAGEASNPPLEPKAAFGPTSSSPQRSPAEAKGIGAAAWQPSSSPLHSLQGPPQASPQSTSAGAPLSLAPAKAAADGARRGGHLANLRHNVLKNLSGAGGGSVPPVPNRDAAATPAKSNRPPLALAGGGKSPRAKEDVNVDSLIAELLSGAGGNGLVAQRQAPAPDSGDGSTMQRKLSSFAKNDPVATLLSTSRYRTNSSLGSHGGIPAGTTNPTNHMSPDANANSNSHQGERHLLYNIRRNTGDTKKFGNLSKPVGSTTAGTPSVSPAGKVTPSLQELLARNRKGAFSVLNK